MLVILVDPQEKAHYIHPHFTYRMKKNSNRSDVKTCVSHWLCHCFFFIICLTSLSKRLPANGNWGNTVPSSIGKLFLFFTLMGNTEGLVGGVLVVFFVFCFCFLCVCVWFFWCYFFFFFLETPYRKQLLSLITRYLFLK